MTPKIRLLKTLAGEVGDSTPAAPIYLSLFLEDFERAYYIEQYRRRMRGINCLPVDHAEDTRFRAEAVYQSYGIFKSRPDWMDIRQGAGRDWAARTEIVAEDGVLYYRDRETGRRTAINSVPLVCGPQAEGPETHSDLWDRPQAEDDLQMEMPTPVPDVQTLLERGDFDLPRRIVANYGDEYFISTTLSTPYMSAYYQLGFQDMMTIQYDEPERFHRILEQEADRLLPVVDAWADVGVDGIFVEEVLSGADIISAQAYEEFAFAYNRRLFQYIAARGLHGIHYVCGDVMPRLERMADLDVTAIAVEESKKNFSIRIEDVVERIGKRKVVFGNVDSIEFGLWAAMDAIPAEVRRQVQAGRAAQGFVVSTGSPFPLDTNPRRIDALVRAAHAQPESGGRR